MEAVVSRLEAVAARLEKYESSVQRRPAAAVASASSRSVASARTPQAAAANRATAPAPSPAVPVTGSPGKYDEAAWMNFIEGEVSACTAAASALAEEFRGGTVHFVNGANAMVDVIKASQQRAKPAIDEFQRMLPPLADAMQKLDSLTRGARTKATNHHKAITECLQGFTWITYDASSGGPTAEAIIADGLGSSEMFINRVIMEFRDVAPEHKVWALAVKDAMKKLMALQKLQFPMGLTWTGTGSGPTQPAQPTPPSDPTSAAPSPASQPSAATAAPEPTAASQSIADAGAEPSAPDAGSGGVPDSAAADEAPQEAGADAAAGAAGSGSGPAAPPPPPPPPPPGMLLEKLQAAGGGGGGADTRGALMSALNRGSDVTSGLRKVTADMKTKNQKDRSGMVKATAAAKKAEPVRGPPRKELLQNRWEIENWVACEEAVSLKEEEVKRSHAVYISHCSDCVIQVLGKVNTVMLDKCRKVGLVFGSVVSTVELVNCSSCKVQCNTACPTLNVDKTDGVQVYLSAEAAAATEVVSSKSSSMSVTVLPEDAEAEPAEHPVPEQFMSKVVDGKLVTVPISHV